MEMKGSLFLLQAVGDGGGGVGQASPKISVGDRYKDHYEDHLYLFNQWKIVSV